ncbi:pirin family protein [Streptomyces sp. LX-29]|uniref:pirin family protein n=1 Tax=Streptomyces sp. LX-29 TaxID=2900152 RepID=UPI00240E6D37|nr:pirin-like bicupin family protein [Streptomyces sp. LX-29]WFB11804.1 pirin family protein [Streptomyces sp. LX-29]
MWVQRASERYRGGDGVRVDTRHAFSFSGFYDPDNVRFGMLAACNEERLAPGAGFDEHPHRDVEIVTWVVEGELTHEDSTGHRTVVRPGDVQRLSAGSGVRHTERNAGPEPLRFVQMWLTPAEYGGAPAYEVLRGIADATPYPVPRAEAVLHVRRVTEGERVAVPAAPWVYVHVVHGSITLGGEWLGPGDAARIDDCEGLEAESGPTAELLIWEMHAEPTFG